MTAVESSAFQSTLPVWGATRPQLPCLRHRLHFNPRSPCGERRLERSKAGKKWWGISIHAPRVGSDITGLENKITLDSISIHAPRVGSDAEGLCCLANEGAFQSTLPVWGATRGRASTVQCGFISIHAPRVGSDGKGTAQSKRILYFNPRSPCGERPKTVTTKKYQTKFQSTLPVWGATQVVVGELGTEVISIHAPRVGSDVHQGQNYFDLKDFNPRSPCGERRGHRCVSTSLSSFQSTLPVWGATLKPRYRPLPMLFQSTLPVWGATRRQNENFVWG